MRSTILYIAMSLDGYIADTNGSVDWLAGDGSAPDTNAEDAAFFHSIDTIILGRRTYDQITTELSPEAWPYEPFMTYVITHHPLPAQANIHFTDELPSALVRRLRRQSGKSIWVCGGATIVQPLLRDRLIDRLQITLIPTLLGGGMRLFDTLTTEESLRLIRTRTTDGMVELTYEKREAPALLSLRDHPEWAERAATWFHEKWQVPREIYADSIAQSMANNAAWPQWYIVTTDDAIIAGCGVAEDFHDRPDLMPNLVALYVEPPYRSRGIAGALLAHACADLYAHGIDTLYLITEHDSFYERYDWRFLTMAHDEDGQPIRMYVHENGFQPATTDI